MKWMVLLLGILANASASVLIKVAVSQPRSLPTLADPMAALSNWPLWAGLALYGLAFVLYAAALSFFPLHVAHPILTAGAITTVALLSRVLFHEAFTWTTTLGIGLVIAGVVLITVRTP